MSTPVAELIEWFDEGLQDSKNTHMIVVCDTFDWEDYPVYVKEDQDVREVEAEYRNKSMQKVMEVYDLKMGRASQFVPGVRVFNY